MSRLGLTALALAATLSAQRPIAGCVRWPDRAPAVGVVVELRWRAHPELPGLSGHSLGTASATTRTGDDGRWRVDAPAAGPFEVHARTADGAHAASPCFPAMAGAFVEQELRTAVEIAGTVHAADGAPVADLELQIVPHDTTWSRLGVYGIPVLRTAVRTDRDGRFSLALPLSYLESPRWEPFLVPAFATTGRWLERPPMLRPTNACTRLELTLEKPDVVAGKVRDGAGLPLAGARVLSLETDTLLAITGDDGAFRVPARSPRSLLFWRDGFAPHVPAAAEATGTEVDVRLATELTVRARLVDELGAPLAGRPVLWSVPLAAGAPLEVSARTDADGRVSASGAGGGFAVLGFVRLEGGYVPFARVLPMADTDLGDVRIGDPRRLEGDVVDAVGTPLANARVVVTPKSLLPAETGAVTYTDHGGRFAFAALPAGPLRVMVEASTNGLTGADVDAGARSAHLAMPAVGVVEVEVIDDQGVAAPGAWVTLVRGGGVRSGIAPSPTWTSTAVAGHTGADGLVRFRGLPAGDWQVLANRLHERELYGGGASTTTDGDRVRVTLQRMRE